MQETAHKDDSNDNGWSVERNAIGDLDGDGKPDSVEIQKNGGDDRRLVIKLDGNTVQIAPKLLPSANEQGGLDLNIVNRTIRLEIGGIGTGLFTYSFIFRLQESHFFLIGYDSTSERGGGQTSVNFSTGRATVIEGDMKEPVVKKVLSGPVRLEDVGAALGFDPSLAS